MPNIDELLNEHRQEISEESALYANAQSHEIPRDPLRRPWSGLNETIQATPSGRPAKSWGRFATYVSQHMGLGFGLFFVTLLPCLWLAESMPTTYSSTLHLFNPEKTDSIGSRLTLFSNRMEFASFPVDFKIPLNLIARRLRGPEARDWVTARLHERGAPIDPRSVAADTFYLEGSEVLVVAGYANTAELALQATNLYWDFLEKEMHQLRKQHLVRVEEWAKLTRSTLETQLSRADDELATIAQQNQGTEKNRQLQLRLAEHLSDLELKQEKVRRERDALATASRASELEQIWKVNDPDIQDLRAIDRALAIAPNESVEDARTHRLEIESHARELLRDRLGKRNLELQAIDSDLRDLHRRVTGLSSAEAGLRLMSQEEQDLLKRRTEYRTNLEELEHLSAQIKVEQDLTPQALHPVQTAVLDPGTRRPLPILKYGLVVVTSLVLTGLLLMLCQLLARPNRLQKDPLFSRPLPNFET